MEISVVIEGDGIFRFLNKEPYKLHEVSKGRVENFATLAGKLHSHGHLSDGFAMCSYYCFNTNIFFSPELFDELIASYLKEIIDEYGNYDNTVP